MQRRATQMVGAIKHLPYEQRQRLRRLDLPSLYYRRRRGDMLTIHQLFHGDMALSPSKFLTRHTREQTRGHQWKLQKPRAQTLIQRNSLSCRIINDWNSLPDSVVSATTTNQFKARLDRLWINSNKTFHSHNSNVLSVLTSSMRMGPPGQVAFFPDYREGKVR